MNVLQSLIFLLVFAGCMLLLNFAESYREAKRRQSEKQRLVKKNKVTAFFSAKVKYINDLKRSSAVPSAMQSVISVMCAVTGFVAGNVVFSSPIIAIVVGAVSSLTPLLYLQLLDNKHQQRRLERLASSMMILSQSYIVTENLIDTFKDNVDLLEEPEPFRNFLAYVTLMDSDVTVGLRRLEQELNNIYCSQWIDALILAQQDRNVKYVAVSVVDGMQDMLEVQQESNASMFSVWREYFLLLVMLFTAPMVFRFFMPDAYIALTNTSFGNGLFIALIASVVFSVFRALKINKPFIS